MQHSTDPPKASAVPDAPPGAHRQFIDLVQETDGVLWEMDAQTWRFTFVSERAERLFGYPLNRWYDEPTFWQDQLLHPEDRDWCVNYCSVASGQCQNHAFLYRGQRADGSEIWIKDVVRVISGQDGRPTVMRGVMVDATEEVELLPEKFELQLDYDAPELESLRKILVA